LKGQNKLMDKRKFFMEWKSEKNKRRKIHILVTIISVLVILGSFGGYQIYSYPLKINYTFMSLMFQLGNEANTKKVPIEIKGTYARRLFESDVFNGTVTIDNKRFSGESVRISSATKEFYGLNDGFVQYGRMYTDDNFESFNIWIYDKVENSISFKWDNGYMISYPAENREEALEVTNKLAQSYIDDRKLK
jgi:hypothetical protein